IHLWDLTTGKELWKVRAYDNGRDFTKPDGIKGLVGIYALAFFPDGRTLAVSECSARVSLWDVATGKPTGQIDQMQAGSGKLLFLPDGKTLVSIGSGSVQFWVNGKARQRTVATPGVMQDIATTLSADGKFIAVGKDRPIAEGEFVVRLEGTVSLWDVATEKELQRLEVPTQVLGMALSPDGKTLAYSQYAAVHL